MGTTDVSRTSSPFIDAVCSRPAVVHNPCCNRLNIAHSLDRCVPLMHSQQRQETEHDGDVSRIVDILATLAENFRKTALHDLTPFYHFQDDEYTIWGQSIAGNGVSDRITVRSRLTPGCSSRQQLPPGQPPAVRIAVLNNRRRRALFSAVLYWPTSPSSVETALQKPDLSTHFPASSTSVSNDAVALPLYRASHVLPHRTASTRQVCRTFILVFESALSRFGLIFMRLPFSAPFILLHRGCGLQ
jgi:hypothetical protein